MKFLFLMFLSLLTTSIVYADNNGVAQKIKLQVTENGFQPDSIKVKSGAHVILKVTRLTDSTCATNIQVKEKHIKMDLPLNKEVQVDLGMLSKGDIRFACGMDMISGHVVAQ